MSAPGGQDILATGARAQANPRRRTRFQVLAVAAVAVVSVVALSASTSLSQGGGASLTSDGPGVSADSIKVGFVWVDLGALQKVLPVKSDPAGDPPKDVQIVTDWINAHGGLGGKTMVSVVEQYPADKDSPQQEEALCNALTQDEQVFAAVLNGQFQANARPCYQKSDTVMVDNTYYPLDRKGYEDFAPYLWSITQPQYDEFVPAYVSGLKQQGFFEGAQKVGIAAPDTPVNRRVVETMLTPELTEAGVGPTEQYFVDVSDTASLGKGTDKMAQTFKSSGVDRVLFLGGQRLAPIFTQSAAVFEFKVPWGMSTFDNLRYYSDNVDTLNGLTDGAKAISFSITNDIADRALPYPGTFAEAQCQQIYAEAGREIKTRAESKNPTLYCQAALFIKAVIDSAGPTVNAQTFAKAAEALGTTFQAGSEWATLFAPGRYASSAAYRLAPWDQDCQCFKPEGGDVPFTP